MYRFYYFNAKLYEIKSLDKTEKNIGGGGEGARMSGVPLHVPSSTAATRAQQTTSITATVKMTWTVVLDSLDISSDDTCCTLRPCSVPCSRLATERDLSVRACIKHMLRSDHVQIGLCAGRYVYRYGYI